MTNKLMPVKPSGGKLGKSVTADEFLSYIKPLILKKDWIKLVGGLATQGQTSNDFDILIDPVFIGELEHTTEFRLVRGFPDNLSKRLTFLDQTQFTGPFTDYYALGDLVFVPHEPFKLIQMSFRAAPEEIIEQAEKSKKFNTVSINRAFYPMKPTRGAYENEEQNISNFVKLITDFPVLVSKKFDGNTFIFYKLKDTVRVYSDDGLNRTSDLQVLINEVKKIDCDSVIFLAEVELWVDGVHYPREAVRSALSTKHSNWLKHLTANIFDIIYINGRDIHLHTAGQRHLFLTSLFTGIQSTNSVPRPGFNLVPQTRVSLPKNLTRIVTALSKLPASEGVIVKKGNYSLTGKAKGNQSFKYHKAATVSVTVLLRTETSTPNVFVYTYGLKHDYEKFQHQPASSDLPDIIQVGKTFNTSIKAKPGDTLLVEFETLNLTEYPETKTYDISFWVPSVIKHSSGSKLATVSEAIKAAEKEGILQRKWIVGSETYYDKNKVPGLNSFSSSEDMLPPFHTKPAVRIKYSGKQSELDYVWDNWATKYIDNGIICQPKFDGFAVYIVKKGSEVKIHDSFNRDLSSQFPDLVSNLINLPNLVLHGEIVSDIPYIYSVSMFDNEDLRMLTELERIQILEKMMLPEPYVKAKSVVVKTKPQLSAAIKDFCNSPVSEGAILKCGASQLITKTTSTWCKVPQVKFITATVSGVKKTDNGFVYQVTHPDFPNLLDTRVTPVKVKVDDSIELSITVSGLTQKTPNVVNPDKKQFPESGTCCWEIAERVEHDIRSGIYNDCVKLASSMEQIDYALSRLCKYETETQYCKNLKETMRLLWKIYCCSSQSPESVRHEGAEIDLLIPIADGESLSERVLEGILQQKEISLRILIRSRPKNKEDRIKSIVENRNALAKMASSEYVFLLDSDVVLDSATVISECLNRLRADDKLALVSYPVGVSQTQTTPNHLSLQATLVRKSVLDQIPFRYTHDYCECGNYAIDLREHNWKFTELDAVPLTHLHHAEAARTRCMSCTALPVYEVLWAEGKAHAWFCKKHFEEWAKKSIANCIKEGYGANCEIDAVKEVEDSRASVKFSDNKNSNIWSKLLKTFQKTRFAESVSCFIASFPENKEMLWELQTKLNLDENTKADDDGLHLTLQLLDGIDALEVLEDMRDKIKKLKPFVFSGHKIDLFGHDKNIAVLVGTIPQEFWEEILLIQKDFGTTLGFDTFKPHITLGETKDFDLIEKINSEKIVLQIPMSAPLIMINKFREQIQDTGPTNFSVEFQPRGLVATFPDNKSLLQDALSVGIDLPHKCSGKGECSECKIKISSGLTSPLTASEKELLSEDEISSGWRLACQCFPQDHLRVSTDDSPLSSSDTNAKDASEPNPYLQYPPHGKKMRLMRHAHFRRASVHFDARRELVPDKWLVGQTENVQIENTIKEDIDTMAKAETIVKDYSFTDGNEYLKPLQSEVKIVTETKHLEPFEWYSLSGVRPPGTEGATKDFPGVMYIIDTGLSEWGAMKPSYREYFDSEGKIFNGRYIVREVEDEWNITGEKTVQFCWYADDLLPYVLSKRSVEKKWMPPDGQSALPKSIRDIIPRKFQFWYKKGQEARTIRDALVKEKIITSDNLVKNEKGDVSLKLKD